MDEQPIQPIEKQKFHHRHFPHFIKWGKAAMWKFFHLYFVILIHILTDKYEQKKHHLAIDMMYAVITFMLVGVNLGVGLWYIQHVEPPQFDLKMITASEVTSGRTMDIATLYASKNKDIQNVEVFLYTPEDFAHNGKKVNSPQATTLGSLASGTVDRLQHSGIVFGNTGDVHSFSAIAQYEYQGRRYYEVSHRTVTVSKTSFTASIHFPKNVAVGFPSTGVIKFNNKSDIAREQVEFTMTLPRNFVLQDITYKNRNLDYHPKKGSIIIPKIAAHKKGKIEIHGYFLPAKDQAGIVGGDQESQIGLSVSSQIAGGIVESGKSYVYIPRTFTTVRVIEPRVVVSIVTTAVVNFGESIQYTITVSNTGDDVAEDVTLYATTNGAALAPGAASAISSLGATTYGSVGNVIALPVIPKIAEGATETITLSVPTVATNDINATGSIFVSGSAYSPLVDFDIPLSVAGTETRFTSQVNVAVSSTYYGPTGEQLGYGPYPPQATEPTALLVLVRVDNTNNAISGTTVSTTLPSQVEWRGESSVSGGSPLQWDPASRTVSWNIGSVPPQSGVYAAQFEVMIVPNEEQVGQFPYLTNGWSLSASDSFTGAGIAKFAGPIVLANAVEEAPKEKDGVPVDEVIVEEDRLDEIVIE